jgi:cell cycle protein kinase DBF2
VLVHILIFTSYITQGITNSDLDFLDYYFQLLGYIGSRKERRAHFDQDTAARNLSPTDYAKEFKSYCGRERVVLRKRRAKLRVEQFHIIAQVGQGGYGEVYLARKQETGEVCALKKMKKRTLYKMDEVRSTYVCWEAKIPIVT